MCRGIRQKTQDEYLQDLKNAVLLVYMNKIILKWDKDKAQQWLEKQGITRTKSKQK